MTVTDPRGGSGIALAALLGMAACTTPNGEAISKGGVDPALDGHVEGFAMAYCLRSLGSKGLPEPEARVMREQGDRWAQVVVERSSGDITLFFAMMPALDAAIASAPMAFVKDEAKAGSAPAPVYFCAEIIRQPGVANAMAEARDALAPAYSRR